MLCEGQTEGEFARRLLRPHLQAHGVSAEVTLITTSVTPRGGRHKGGHGMTITHVQRDLALLRRARFDAVTTMLDLYGFPSDAPELPAPWPDRTEDRVAALHRSLTVAAGYAKSDPKFIPGIIAHEFEGLLFTDVDLLVAVVSGRQARPALVRRLAGAIDGHRVRTPEDVNDRPETSPATRIKQSLSGYDKAYHGPVVAERIGLSRIRAACPIFSDWIARLENVGR